MLLILVIPASLTYTFGRIVGDTRQGWAIFATMVLLFVVEVLYGAESDGNPVQRLAGVAGGNIEGKEVRFGIACSALFARSPR